jgi:hypothetical protein
VSIDNLQKEFVRSFLAKYLGESPDVKFFLIKQGNKHYASAAKRDKSSIEGLVRLYVRPVSERSYNSLAMVYADSQAEIDPSLEIAGRYEIYANLSDKKLSPLTREQREYISKTAF